MQINAITEELTMLKQEIVGIKGQHANLHQQSVDHSVLTAGRSAEAMQKIAALEERMGNIASSPQEADLLVLRRNLSSNQNRWRLTSSLELSWIAGPNF